jgi:hypothetical protein
MTRRHVSTFDALTVRAHTTTSRRHAGGVLFAGVPDQRRIRAGGSAGNHGSTAFGEPRPTAFGDPTREPGELGQQLDDMLYAYLQSAPGVQNVNTRHDRRLYGTLVKLAQPQRVWVLTGHRDFRTGYYEGQWPD